MATGDKEDWQMCQASVEEHVPTAIEDFTLAMFDLFSHRFSVETGGNIDSKMLFSKRISSCLHAFERSIIC